MPHVHYTADEPTSHRHRHRHHHAHHHDSHRHQDSHRHHPEAPDFRFCVELGLVIRSRRQDHKTSSSLESELSTQLSLANIPNHTATTHPSRSSPDKWTISPELCIPSRPRDHRFGMRLTSPFFRFSRHPKKTWQSALTTLFTTLNTHFELTTTHQCYTHIHLVPAQGYWSLPQAKALAKSALYFERCLDALVPPYRRKSVWAKSNRLNRYFGACGSMAECFARVDAQVSVAGLATRMNWCAGDSATGLALGKAEGRGEDFRHEGFRWGFGGLNGKEESGFGTVAYRQPPGATSGEEVMTWVMLVGCLARLSCGLGGGLELQPGVKAQLGSLGEWLVYEAEWCGMPNKGLLKELVRQAVPVTEAKGVRAGMDADVITIDEDQRLRWKEHDRDIVDEKYRRLLKIA